MDETKAALFKRALAAKKLKRLPRPRKIIYPSKLEREYEKELEKLITRAHKLVDAFLLPKLETLVRGVAKERGVKLDAYSDDVANIMASIGVEFERDYTKKEIEALARKTGKDVDYWNERQIAGSLKPVVSFDVFGKEPWLDSEMSAFAAENVNLISSLSGDFFQDVQDKTLRAIGEGQRWEDIADEIKESYGVSQSRANLIARDQVGKLQGQLTQLRQEDIGISKYIWRTAGDGRVRESHRDNANKIFAWSDPPATGNPGEDYQCRCYGEPYLGDILSEP